MKAIKHPVFASLHSLQIAKETLTEQPNKSNDDNIALAEVNYQIENILQQLN